jgi:hypothetical protein
MTLSSLVKWLYMCHFMPQGQVLSITQDRYDDFIEDLRMYTYQHTQKIFKSTIALHTYDNDLTYTYSRYLTYNAFKHPLPYIPIKKA